MSCNPTTHIDECPHAFVKNGVVEQIAVFKEADHGAEILNLVQADKSADTVVCLCEFGSVPHLYSTWDGTSFTPPTLDYLYSIGISNVNQAMADARNAANAAEIAAEAAPATTEPAAPTA
jgi:hypothetical protein